MGATIWWVQRRCIDREEQVVVSARIRALPDGSAERRKCIRTGRYLYVRLLPSVGRYTAHVFTPRIHISSRVLSSILYVGAVGYVS